MEDVTFKRILQDRQFHLQLKSEQKEIIQNLLERKDSMAFDFHFDFFSNICHVTSRKLRLPQCIMGDDLHVNKQTNICKAIYIRVSDRK
jgi:hypothetical protein